MSKPHIAISYKPGGEERKLWVEELSDFAEVVFLTELSSEERKVALSNADILVAMNIAREVAAEEYAEMKKLRLLQMLSAGANHVPFVLVPPEVIIASNVGIFSVPIAEHVLAMVLALAKDLVAKHEKLKAGISDQHPSSRVLRGSVCGILGFGGIGQATARLMRAFGAKIFAVNTTGLSAEPNDFIGTLNDLETVLKASDMVVIALPLKRATLGFIGKRELAWMKDQAILINVARAEIIDERALYEHLIANPRFMAGTDVWWREPLIYGEFRTNYPFLDLPNFLGSPHRSAFVPGIMVEATQFAIANLMRFFRGEPLRGIVRREEY